MDTKKKEFIALFQRSGWTQAHAARQLEMTRGGINGIITGPTIPSESAIKLFRLTLLTERPWTLSGGTTLDAAPEGWEQKLVQELRQLKPEERNHILSVIKTLIAGSAKPRATLGGAGLTETERSELGEIARKGAEALVSGLPGASAPASGTTGSGASRPKRKAVLTSGKSVAPKKGVAAH